MHTQPAAALGGAAALPLAAGKPDTPSTYRGHTRDPLGTVSHLSHARLLPVDPSMQESQMPAKTDTTGNYQSATIVY